MLTQRQLQILKLIVQVYTATEIPVGSKTLMNEGIKASSATIRNDMMALESQNLIAKTHSSSGRVPTIEGYRYYIDHLLQPVDVKETDVLAIRKLFGHEFHAINDIVERSAQILSYLTSYTALSLGPEVNERKLTGFRVVSLNNRQILGIIVTDKGNVESQVFTKPPEVSSQDIEKMVRIINDRLVGENLLTVYQKLRTEIPLLLNKYFQTPQGIMELFDTAFNPVFENRVYVEGQMNLLDWPMLHDLDHFKSLYSLFDDKEELLTLLSHNDQEISIRIGSEIDNKLLQDMSLITATYDAGKHGRGTIALLGPTNMPYSKMFSIVDVFRKEMAEQLIQYYNSLDSSDIS